MLQPAGRTEQGEEQMAEGRALTSELELANGIRPLFVRRGWEKEEARVGDPPRHIFSIDLRKIFKIDELWVFNLIHVAQNLQNK